MPSHLKLLVILLCVLAPARALAWGDEGHRIVARIAEPLLTPTARAAVDALLAADADTLTAPDFASRATWADKWRDSDRNGTKQRYTATAQWHFVDMEIDAPDLRAACFGLPTLPAGTPASAGPAQDCVVDKISEFESELADSTQPEAERILALKYLEHFVGDLHQPLHASDDHDRGGNDVMVLFGRRRVASRLHAFWDTAVVERLGRDETSVAMELSAAFAAERSTWSAGTPAVWGQESFEAARDVAYGFPPETEPDEHGIPAHRLNAAYEAMSEITARTQLAKAGFRLAAVLNAALR